MNLQGNVTSQRLKSENNNFVIFKQRKSGWKRNERTYIKDDYYFITNA